MARPCARCNLCWNPPSVGKDELAGAALTESSGTPTPSLVVSRALTSAPATALALTLSLDNELFQQFMKAYLEAQVTSQTKVDPELCKQPLKARFLDLYYDNLHIDCYWFYQQCKDHFETAKGKKLNKIPFAASFLRGLVI